MTGKRIFIMMILGGLLLAATPRHARSEDELPSIVRIQLYVEDGHVIGDITSDGLFSERIIGTVRSGLPAVVELFYYLSLSGDGTILKDVRRFSLGYDVWEDVYSVAREDTTVYFPDFSGMRKAIENLRKVKLISVEEIEPSRSYRIGMSIAINPLQGIDERKIEGWISENMRSSRDNSWREQMLNINDLITHFFSREKETVNRSEWHRTVLFELSSLPLFGEEVE